MFNFAPYLQDESSVHAEPKDGNVCQAKDNAHKKTCQQN